MRNSAWKGQLIVVAITDADAPGKLVHSVYRAKVRNFCANLGYRVNATALTKHKLQSIVEGGTDRGIRTADGYEQSTFNFNIDFSIQGDAWLLLIDPPLTLQTAVGGTNSVVIFGGTPIPPPVSVTIRWGTVSGTYTGSKTFAYVDPPWTITTGDGLVNGTTYYFIATGDTSIASNEVSGTPQAP